MELFRAWNPDSWMFADSSAALLSEVATILSELRYFAALPLNWVEGEVPKRLHPARYGPPREDDDVEAEEVKDDGPNEVERARAVAASMR